VRILAVNDLNAKSNYKFGSCALSITHLATGQNHVALAQLDPGGRIGRHKAASQQLLLVMHGTGIVSNEERQEATLGPGQAVLWEAGEEHETNTARGMVALIIEGDLKL
jgi:quercetin dioxygenase-like cupin family protein